MGLRRLAGAPMLGGNDPFDEVTSYMSPRVCRQGWHFSWWFMYNDFFVMKYIACYAFLMFAVSCNTL